MDLAIDRDLPKLVDKLGVANARAAVSVASGDAVGRADASGGDGGESAALTVAADIEGQTRVERVDRIGDFFGDESVSIAKACGGFCAGSIVVKPNVDIGEDVLHVRFGSAERQNGKAVVASQEGARLVAG